MPASTRWLVGLLGEALREPLFLHVFDDGEDAAEMDWSAARIGALQFGSHEAAARFAAAHRLADVEISEHPATELIGAVHHVPDRTAAVS